MMVKLAAKAVSVMLFAVAFASVSTASFMFVHRAKVPAELLKME
jgi:cyclic lactone autoinducer peptide